MIKLVLLRHGESLWNKENRFTGWVDIGLSQRGIVEAQRAAELLKEKGLEFDVAYTSVLRRAIRSLWVVLSQLDIMWLPVIRSWRLNEKHYGALQGLNKAETAIKYGEAQVLQWRRSFDIAPPPLEKTDEHYLGNDARYKDLDEKDIPTTECLKDVIDRLMPLLEKELLPALKAGKRLLIVAHGNSLRALIKYFDKLSNKEIMKVNVPTGIPLIYELDDHLKPIKHYYLGDPAAVKKAIENVAKQGKAGKN